MALCIHPRCPQPNHPENSGHTHCQACGADLLVKGRYRVMRLLTDASGFGQVYEVFEQDQPRILKILKPRYNDSPKAIQLFQQEALVLSHLNHPGLPQVEPDGGFQLTFETGGPSLHCIVMEKIDGPNLSEWMRQQGGHPIREPQALNWLGQLTEVLHLVHQQHYFHRDIKPENIMLRSSGQLVLVDFGAAREMSPAYFEQLGATGGITRISSAGYTAPEQERGQAVPQSDFFALGCTFIYLLTGKKPTDTAIYRALTNEFDWRPFAPHIATDLADLIDQLTASRVVDRPPDTAALLATIRRIQDGDRPVSIPMHPPGPLPGLSLGPSLRQSLSSPDTPANEANEANDANDASQGNRTLPPLEYGPESGPSASATTIGPADTLVQQSVSTTVQPEQGSRPPRRLSRMLWLGLGTLALLLLGGGALWKYHRRSSLPDVSQLQRQVDRAATLDGHGSAINALVISADQQRLVSASDDKTVRIWNMVTGEQEQQLTGHRDRIHAVAMSPDGQVVASGGGDTLIKLWDSSTGEPIGGLTGHKSSINSLTFSPDGQTLVSAGADKIIRIWDVAAQAEIGTLMGHNSFINDIAISPDGTVLASGAADRTIKLWNLLEQRELGTLSGHTSFINDVEFSLDGTRLISAGADNQIRVWDHKNYELDMTLAHHDSFVNALAMTPDGRVLISASADQTLALWDLKTGQFIQSIDWANTFVDAVAVRVTGSTRQVIAGGQGSNAIQIWNVTAQE